MNVNGTRIKDEVIAGARAFIQSRRDGFTSNELEVELIGLLRGAGQPASLAISMTLRFLSEERDRGFVQIVGTNRSTRKKTVGRNIWQVTWKGLHNAKA